MCTGLLEYGGLFAGVEARPFVSAGESGVQCGDEFRTAEREAADFNAGLTVPNRAARTGEIDFQSEDAAVFLTLDGQIGIELARGDHIVVRKAQEKLRLVRPAKKTYFEILRSKLKWGER